MYLFFGVLFLVLIVFVCLNFRRKKKIIHKICSMCAEEKCELLNRLIRPFGYSYVSAQDIFTTRRNAWQRGFGYRAIYDKNAIHLNMVFDCLPVYFDYDGKTWLIELWKGQYGICTGCEIGVYHADRILSEKERDSALFRSVGDGGMPRLSLILFHGRRTLARLSAKHWWLTAFLIGHFSNPSELSLHAAIVLPAPAMASAFYEGLVNTGFDPCGITVCGRTVSFTFTKPVSAAGFWRRLREKLVQRMNRLGCRLYLFITRPFCQTVDRLLYLYFYLPFVFRKVLSNCMCKCKRGKRGCHEL